MLVVGMMLRSAVDELLVAGRTVRALAEEALAGLTVVEHDSVPADAVVVVHDPACPTVPSGFVSDLVRRCGETGRPQIAVLPVTDTVKAVAGARVGTTLDRDSLAVVASPIVLPPGVRSTCTEAADIARDVRVGRAVDLVAAPAGTVRLADPDDLRVLLAHG